MLPTPHILIVIWMSDVDLSCPLTTTVSYICTPSLKDFQKRGHPLNVKDTFPIFKMLTACAFTFLTLKLNDSTVLLLSSLFSS